MNLERQIVDLLQVASKRLAYCEVILDFPQKNGKRDYDVSKEITLFYFNVCVTNFHDSLIIIGSLLGNDTRVISFFNWSNFMSKKTNEISKIILDYKNNKFHEVRNQIVAHADVSNPNNFLPHLKTRSLINIKLIVGLRKIINDLTTEFFDFTQQSGTPYSPNYFDTKDAVEEIESVMYKAMPPLIN